MIVQLLTSLPEILEIYGYVFRKRIYYEQRIGFWVIAYIPIAVTQKTKAKKKMLALGRWIDQTAKISTNGSAWLIAKPIEDHTDNASFEKALRDMTYDLGFLMDTDFQLNPPPY